MPSVLMKQIDGKFVEAAQVLNSTPEAVFATILSSFLESFDRCLEQTLAAQRQSVPASNENIRSSGTPKEKIK